MSDLDFERERLRRAELALVKHRRRILSLERQLERARVAESSFVEDVERARGRCELVESA